MTITREDWSWQFDYCFACGQKPWGVLVCEPEAAAAAKAGGGE